MDKLKVVFIGASCTIFAAFAFYNIKKLFGGGDDPTKRTPTPSKLSVLRVSA